MTNQELNDLKNRYVANGAATPTTQFAERAENAELWDADGNRWIDFAGGIGVLNLGHRHPKIVAAVEAQLKKVMHTSAAVISYAPYVQLCQKLCELSPVRGPERKAMTGKVLPYKNDFGPMPGDVFRAPFPNPLHGISEEASLDAIRTLFKTDIAPHRTAAIVIEPVQGEGGFYIASPDYLKALRALCDEHGILLIADEVQSGFARTGKLFALEHSGIEADILTTAKSLANGMPLSAVVGTAKVMDASGPNSLGGTYSGNPLSCAAALAVIEVIEEENILERSEQMGKMLAERFAVWEERFPAVAHGRQLGAMAAFELLDSDGKPNAQMTGALCAKAREKGLILLSCGFYGNSIRILVPLTVSTAVLEEGLSIIEQSLEALS